jgi:hypothetical protein
MKCDEEFISMKHRDDAIFLSMAKKQKDDPIYSNAIGPREFGFLYHSQHV